MRITKVALGVMLVVLLSGTSEWVFQGLTLEGNMLTRCGRNNPGVNLCFAGSWQDGIEQQNTFHVTDPTDSNLISERYLSKAQDRFVSAYGFGWETRAFQSGFAANYGRFFDTAELKGFSSSGHGSAELVIGMDSARPDSQTEIEDCLRKNDGKLVDSISIGDQVRAVVVDVPISSEFSFISAVKTAAATTFIEPNTKYQADSVPSDPDWRLQQWAPKRIWADYAWNTTVGNHSVLVAVIDTGVDWNHPDLTANYVALGYDWVNLDSNPMDDYGHGTHVAGIIAAALNNGVGIAGLAQVRIMAEKVLDETGSGSVNQIAQGIVHAVDQGADIINLSLGSPYDSRLIHEAVRYAYEHEVLIVAAAGNERSDAKHYPAAYDEVIAVTATDEADEPAFFTFGDWVEVGAPGDNIYSTMWDDSYVFLSGTSMAAPHVVGVAALILSQFPNMTRDQVWAQLQHSADDLGELGFDIYYGFGRVNAKKAVEQAPSDHDLLVFKLNAPPYLRPGTVAVINTTILNMGTSPESNVLAELLINGSVIASAMIDFLMSSASTQVSFSWNATVEGVCNVTSYTMPLSGETAVGNNALSKHVEIRPPRVLRVPDQYGSIQEAIDAAEKGDTVFVASGTYYENLRIRKEDLNLTGEDQCNTIIDGSQVADVIFVWASDKVRISRLTVRNGRRAFTYSGIYVLGTNEITISEVTASDNYHGMYLTWTTRATLRNNNMTENRYNFGADGGSLDHYMHDIDATNAVNGKPVYYMVNTHDQQIPSGAGYLAVINSTGISAKDLDFENNLDGILFACATGCSIQNVSVSRGYGGIRLYQSSNNYLSNNIVNSNEFGIYLSYSENNFLRDNHMIANTFNFRVDGDSIASFIHEIDASNTVDEKPIYYLVNEDNRKVPQNAGYVAAVNSSNITIENVNITHNWQGILFAYTNHSRIMGAELSNNYEGIYLWRSDNNIIDDNNIPNGNWEAIGVYLSNGNTIASNTVGQTWLGIDLDRSSNNIIHSNVATDNAIGIVTVGSQNNVIDSNGVSGYVRGIELWYSDNSVVANNKASGAEMSLAGIWLTRAEHNVIKRNNVTHSLFWIGAGIYLYQSSNNNTIVENTLAYNWVGMVLGCRSTHIYVDWNDDNVIHHNSFIQNYVLQVSSYNSINTWDDGYPSGGNYWNGYGQDARSGPYQNMTGSDGISDTPFVIDGQNRDRFPYMAQIKGPYITGDLNHNGKVDIVDLAMAAKTFGTYSGHPNYNPLTDVNNDSKTDIKDLVLIAKNFGKTSQ